MWGFDGGGGVTVTGVAISLMNETGPQCSPSRAVFKCWELRRNGMEGKETTRGAGSPVGCSVIDGLSS